MNLKDLIEKEVCVITGGGSGIGLSAAKHMPKHKIIVLSGRTVKKLEKAIKELEDLGFEAHAFACDVSSRENVTYLVEFAASFGEIKNVIHAAGMSPSMGTPEKLLQVNALGTVYVNQEFSKCMKEGSVIVDVSSNSAYVLPKIIANKMTFEKAETDEEAYIKKNVKLSNLARSEYQKAGFAYALSKSFVVWYAAKCAFDYGNKGIRVVSVSPGLVATDMGNLEAEEGGELIQYAAEKRMGRPEELGFAIATIADERNGYLTGVDILCDGGSTVGKRLFNCK